MAGCGAPAQPVRDYAAAALRQPDRFRQSYRRGDRTQEHPAGELRAGRHPVLQLPDHGGMRHGDAGARLGRQLSELQAPPGVQSPVALADVPQLSAALHCDHYRLVHRRSRPSALGGFWRVANRGCHDAVPDDARGDDLARGLLRGLRLHLPVWHVLHLSAYPHRSGEAAARSSASRGSEPADAAGRRRTNSRTQPRRRPRITVVKFWVSLLAISVLLYVLLDGVDLGVGLLFGLASGEARRGAMLRAVAPIWDGNETWLVVTAVILWGAFPLVYANLLSAFYLPLIVMLLGLILRGVAFEFRYKTQRLRWIWDLSFAGGSLIATFIQGLTVGALVKGLQVTNGQYSGGAAARAPPVFGLLCLPPCLGYALLAPCSLANKCTTTLP